MEKKKAIMHLCASYRKSHVKTKHVTQSIADEFRFFFVLFTL